MMWVVIFDDVERLQHHLTRPEAIKPQTMLAHTHLLQNSYYSDVTVRDEENNFADFDEDAVEDPSLIIVPEGKLIFANIFGSGSHIRTCNFDGQGLRTVFALVPDGAIGAWTL